MTRSGVLRDDATEARSFWRRVEHLDVVDSTNTYSLREPSPWRLVSAGEQTAARGRRGRTWVSPPGTSVAMSMTVPLGGHPAPGWMPLLTGLAVVDAVALLAPRARVALKWPNDVLAAGSDGADAEPKKVAGILCQVATPALVVVGVGINVSVPAEALPVATATSLHVVDPDAPGPSRVVEAVADAFAARYGDWAAGGARLDALRADYRAACATIGAVVDVHVPQSVVRGRVMGVDDGGELMLRPADDDAATVRYAAGDVVHVRPGAL